MKVRFPPPQSVAIAEVKIHPYPYEIGIQTHEFIHAILFHQVFQDCAAGHAVRLPGGLDSIQEKMKADGYTDGLLNQGWRFFDKYSKLLENAVYQNAVVQFVAQWDWYIQRIGEFIDFALRERGFPVSLAKDQKNHLKKLHTKQIEIQMATICAAMPERSVEVKDQISELTELFLIRNLGLHNRWEVDQKYLQRSANAENWEIGDVRLIQIGELRRMHKALLATMQVVTREVALEFLGVSPYR
jgi:hypothetical protein